MVVYELKFTLAYDEKFFELPKTLTFYKGGKIVYRQHKVSHIFILPDRIYLFGNRSTFDPYKSLIYRKDFSKCYMEHSFRKNYTFVQKLIIMCLRTKTGSSFSLHRNNVYRRFYVYYKGFDFKKTIDFILTHYKYDDRYYFTEELDLDENSKTYLQIKFTIRERRKYDENKIQERK